MTTVLAARAVSPILGASGAAVRTLFGQSLITLKVCEWPRHEETVVDSDTGERDCHLAVDF
jgi:hypothetical protein